MTFAGACLEVLIYENTDKGLDRPPEFVAVIVAVMGRAGSSGSWAPPGWAWA